jgi:hypothetical protein
MGTFFGWGYFWGHFEWAAEKNPLSTGVYGHCVMPIIGTISKASTF